MVKIIGYDVGGANTKVAFLETKDNSVIEFSTASEYFPVWKMSLNQLPLMLKRLQEQVIDRKELDAIGLTMTAELSDAYRTKREGVNHILDSIDKVTDGLPIFVLDVFNRIISIEEARNDPLSVAAANWVATGWMVSQIIPDCIVLDIGSTSTSIIPVANGKVVAKGKNDLEKLINGELVYTGSLRTNLAAIVSSILIRSSRSRVSSELFAQSGDVHLILGNIDEKDYTVDTADGREPNLEESKARLARIICADIEIINENEIEDISKQIYDAQLDQIEKGLRQTFNGVKSAFKNEPMIVVTGLGRDFLGKVAAERAGFKNVIDLGEVMGSEAALVSPSVGVALMLAGRLEGMNIQWMQQ
jgi:probable H4MPT-linked C1 transfer pathway protein